MKTRWKQFERDCAEAVGGKRYHANTGGGVDLRSDTVVGQCKEVAVLSLAEITKLVGAIEMEAKMQGKLGLVFLPSLEQEG